MDDIVCCLSKNDSEMLCSFFTSEAIASGDAFEEGITYSMNTYNGDILYDEDEYTHERTYHTDIRFTVEEKGDGAGQTKKVNCYYEVETTEGTFIIFVRNVLVRREKTDWETVTGVEYLQVISSDDIESLDWSNDSIGIFTGGEANS